MAISENFTFCIALIVLLSRSLWKKIRKSSEWECEDGATQKLRVIPNEEKKIKSINFAAREQYYNNWEYNRIR
jgi:hypothetical protein